MSSGRQEGFSAVELLITLFVAAAFLVAGYQLYFVVIKDNGQTRAQSRAANVAYNYLRQYSPTVTAPCSPATPLNNSTVNVSGLANVTVSVIITCPYSASTGTNSAINISRVEADVSYGNPAQTLKYSTFTHDTPNATSTDITTGLIGWWKFDGNAQASVGVDGTVNNATLTTGQNGQPNTAYNFNGTNASITVPLSNWPATMNAVTVNFWAKNVNSGAATSVLNATTDDPSNRFNLHFPWSDGAIYWDFGNLATTGRLQTTYNSAWYGTWTDWTFTSSSAGMAIYRNGVSIASTTNYSTFSPGSKTLNIGAYPPGSTYWSGALDDLRVYSRVLSPTEITTLYSNGAQ